MISSTPIRYEEPWAEAFTSFIQYKRGLGLQYDRPEFDLMALSRFLVKTSGELYEITQEAAELWCQRKENESIKGWSYRASVYKQLATYLNSRGIRAYIPHSAKVKIQKYIPHIFTEAEILRIFQEADRLELARQSSYPEIMRVVLRLMFSTGVRISEIVNLNVDDVHLSDAVLFIRKSKNRKSRTIPIDRSVANMLQTYIDSWHGTRTYFFETKRHTAISRETVYDLFRKILFNAEIPHGGRGSGPRLHDIRHTFAVRSLRNMATQGIDIYTALPYLSVYLGHKSIKETEYYLRLTAEIYPELEAKISSYTGHVVPEVQA